MRDIECATCNKPVGTLKELEEYEAFVDADMKFDGGEWSGPWHAKHYPFCACDEVAFLDGFEEE